MPARGGLHIQRLSILSHHLTSRPLPTPINAPFTFVMTLPPNPLSPNVPNALENALASFNSVLQRRRRMRVLILSSDTGGGHRASANALRAALEELYPRHIHVDIVDFWVDLAAGPFSRFPDQYTFLAKHPWMWKFTYEITRFPPGRAITETCFNTFAHRNISAAFTRYAPDLIISVHPLVNTLSHHVLRQMSNQSGLPPIPYVTVVTDLGGAHPTWFHKACDMTYVPSDSVRDIALRVGVPSDNIRQFGLPIRQDFWTSPPPKYHLRETLGIRPDLPTVLAIGGGDGVGGLKDIVFSLANNLPRKLGHSRVQLVIICGKNQSLRQNLQNRTWPIPLTALGYVSNMSDWMAASDILCTKAGPGTIAEGLTRGLPIIVTGFLPGQEEANVKYVVDNDVGTYAKKASSIVKTVASWIGNPTFLADMATRAQRLARPQSSMDIAGDVVEVVRAKLASNAEELKLRIQERATQNANAVAANSLRAYIPHSEQLRDDSDHSLLMLRIRLLLKFAVGSLLVRDAIHRPERDPPSPRSERAGQ